VIAIENARLFNELRQSLQHQTATADVLKIISRSVFDLQTVLDTLVDSAYRLCRASLGLLYLKGDEAFECRAISGVGVEELSIYFKGRPIRAGRATAAERVIMTGEVQSVNDFFADPDFDPGTKDVIRNAAKAGSPLGAVRSSLAVPMMRNDVVIGVLVIASTSTGSFPRRQIELLQTFADQAVIAIENARLFDEVQTKTHDLEEALIHQTGSANILKVIASSPTDVGPVLTAIVESACGICEAENAHVALTDGDELVFQAQHGSSPVVWKRQPINRRWATGRAAVDRRPVHVHDFLSPEGDEFPDGRELARRDGARTVLAIPLLREGECIGVIALRRMEVRPFREKQIELLQTFADQAVIAMENARLFNETQEALEREAAAAEILRVINNSPGNLAPVFDAILEKATVLCGASFSLLATYEGDDMHHFVAKRGVPPEFTDLFPGPVRLGPETGLGRLVRGESFVHILELSDDVGYSLGNPVRRFLVDVAGARSYLAVPLRRDDVMLGSFTIYRREVRPFSEEFVALLQNFAAQAVIAIENARLFNETKEALARQTATADVLKVISRSSVELETVLDTLVDTVTRLCRADQATLFHQRGDMLHLIASRGWSEEAKAFVRTYPLAADRGSLTGRVALERGPVHIPDVLQDPGYTQHELQRILGSRSMLGLPLLREDTLLGIFSISRTRVEPFTSKEIELVTTFADQAVIAIENARLFDELRDRQAELRVTFDNMGDGVVMFDAAARLAAWNRNFQEMLELPDAFLAGRPSYAEYFRYLVDRGEYSADLEADLSRLNEDPWRELRLERTRPDGRVVEVRRNPVPDGGFVLIYADITERKRAEQAIRSARDAAERALRDLQAAQASLVHAQKMAALGQVTAGIAHEIKNPLNFVNNFAGLSVELLDELKEAARAVGALDPGKRAEIVETIRMLTGNLEKIVEHGRRADGIVRSMLQHSRGSSDDRRSTDLNALAEEALNLAYHGARAQDPNFDIALEHDLDSNLAPVDVVPQELTRVLLNLIGNGFYAANKRSSESDGGYRPALKVTTREFGESVEVRVRDNGVGIPLEDRDKLFQPFFTTKPTGEGTGLGLSISYEIVTQQHGGTISVDSEVGDFTEFTVRLPRRQHGVA
jgi:PAS domain S-box-containing protein